MREVIFNLFPQQNQRSKGEAKIFYTYNGELTYVFGQSDLSQVWNTTDSITPAVINISVPVYSTVNYTISCDTDSITLSNALLKVMSNNNILAGSNSNQSDYSGQFFISK
jgi:hypothetical protein